MNSPRALPNPSSILAVVVSRSALLLLLCFASGCDAQTVPTAAPTLACPSEAAAWVQCIQGGGFDAQACAECYFSYGDSITDQTTCEGLTSLICTSLEACAGSCGTGCGSVTELYEACIWGPVCGDLSLQSCSSPSAPTLPTSTPPPAPAPASSPVLAPTADECGTEATAVASCISSTGDLTACLACVQAYGESTPVVTCDDVQAFTCGIEATCPDCGTCQDLQLALVVCQDVSGCGAFECSAAVPTPATTSPPPAASPVSSPPSPLAAPVSEPPTGTDDEPCPTEFDAAQDCLSTEISAAEAESCETCVFDAITGLASSSGQVPSCSSINSAICPAVAGESDCGCGSCSDEILAYLACQVDAASAGCELECEGVGGGGGGAGTAPSPAVVTPTAPTASGGEAPTPTAGGGGGGGDPAPSGPTSGAQGSRLPRLLAILTAISAGAVVDAMVGSLV